MKHDNPAFPVPATGWLYAGMTTRELFAAMAMQGELAGQYANDFDSCTYNEGNVNKLASLSVAAADALIAELSKEKA